MAEYHPLFPPNEEDEEDAEPPDIQEVAIQRKENGKYITAPRTFLIGELPNAAALYNEFGGGEYQLIGRDSRHVLRRRVLLQLPGPAKPLFDEGPTVPEKAPAPSNPLLAMGGQDGGVMGLIMMMMQNMMAQANQASERQTQMMLAMMQASSTGSQAQMAAMQENMRAQAERDQRDKQSQIELMLKLSEARGGSAGDGDSFFKGVEFMRHFSTQQLEMMKSQAKNGGGDFDLEGIIGTVLEALQGFNAFKDMAGVATGAAPIQEIVQ